MPSSCDMANLVAKDDRDFALGYFLKTLWLFTESDFFTFVIPDTCFGVFGALAGPLLTTASSPSLLGVLARTPLSLLYNWGNLLVFDLANQGSEDAALEDNINKPWRPIPTGRMSVSGTRRLLFRSLPIVLGVNYLLGGSNETALLFMLTWMYNGLGGADESFIVRNIIIAFTFGLYNAGSLHIAAGEGNEIRDTGYDWVFLISCVIFSTMHVQDLKDQPGDKARGRRTAPLVLGDNAARWTIAVSVAVWSMICPLFLGLSIAGCLVPCVMGTIIVSRLFFLREQHHDRRTWQLWTAWTASLYLYHLWHSRPRL